MKTRSVMLLLLVIGLTVIGLIDRRYRLEAAETDRRLLLHIVEETDQQLSEDVGALITAVASLHAFMVASPTVPNMAAFDEFAAELIDSQPAVTAFAYTDADRVIRHFYPLAGNEAALNLDLTSRPAAPYVEQAIRQRRTVVSPPTVTVQGQLSAVARTPIYRDDSLIGLVQAIFVLEPVLRRLDESLQPQFAMQLRDGAGVLFWGQPAPGGESRPISSGAVDWTITVTWVDGPPGLDSEVQATIWTVGGLLLFSALIIVYQVQSRTERLVTAVAERTALLTAANEALQDEIRQRRQVEADLRHERDILQRITATNPAGVMLVNAALQITLANPTAHQLLALKPIAGQEGLYELPHWQVMDEKGEPQPHAERPLRRALRTGQLVQNVRLVVDNPGQPRRQLEISVAPITGADGVPEEVVCTLEDVTDRVAAEQALRRSEEHNRALVEQAADAIFFADADGRCLAINPQACAMLGYTHDELLGLSLRQLIAPDNVNQLLILLQGMATGKTIRREGHLVRKDRSLVKVEIKARRLSDGRLLGIVRDVSEREETESTLRRQRAQFAALRQMGLALAAQLELPSLLQSIVAQAVELLQAEAGCLYLYQPERDVLEIVVASGDDALPVGLTLRRGEGLSGAVWTSGKSMVVDDYLEWSGRADEIKSLSTRRSVVAAPIYWGEQFLGVLNVAARARRAFTSQDAALLDLFAAQAAVATQNARLYQAEQRARHTAETLHAAVLAFTQNLDLTLILNTFLDHLAELVEYDSASVMLIEGDGQIVVRAMRGYDRFAGDGSVSEDEMVIGMTPAIERALAGGLIVADTRDQPGWIYHEYLAHVRCWMGVPLIAGGETVGLFSLDKVIPGFFTQTDQQLAGALAAPAAVAIQNARLFAAERSQRRLAEALSQTAVALNRSYTLDEVLDGLLSNAAMIVKHDAADIMLVTDGVAEVVKSHSATDPNFAQRLAFVRLPVATTPDLRRMAESGLPTMIEDTYDDPDWIHYPGTAWIRSYVGAPIRAKDRLIGFLALYSRKPDHFSWADSLRLQGFVEQAAVAIEKVGLYNDLQQYAAQLEQRVTERTRELTAANEQLQELDRLKSKLVDDLSHELRTPLANFSLYLHLLEFGVPDKRNHYLATLQQQLTRLEELVSSILKLSQMDVLRSELSPMELSELKLNELVDQVVTGLQPRAEAAGLAMSFAPDPALAPIRGDRKRLVEAITNLVVNAINYTPAGWVRVTTHRTNNRVCLEVADSGIGIEEEERAYLFERFYRGREVSQSNITGFGLGLSIVADVASLHGGEVEVESEPGVGSAFRLWLPIFDQIPAASEPDSPVRLEESSGQGQLASD